MNHQLDRNLAVDVLQAMDAMYGDSFRRKWSGTESNWSRPEKFIVALQIGLSGLTAEDIQRGLHAMLNKPYAPTIPEFRVWCLQWVNHETLYHFAIAQWIEHEKFDGSEDWASHGQAGVSDRVVFWAAVELKDHLKLGTEWAKIKNIWTAKIDANLHDHGLKPIPPNGNKQIENPKPKYNPDMARAALRMLKSGLEASESDSCAKKLEVGLKSLQEGRERLWSEHQPTAEDHLAPLQTARELRNAQMQRDPLVPLDKGTPVAGAKSIRETMQGNPKFTAMYEAGAKHRQAMAETQGGTA